MIPLMERIRVALDSGDPAKRESLMEYIWRTYGRRISYYISTVVARDSAGFDDIFQEVMIKIFENIGTYNPAYSFNTWIYRVARNHCFDHARRIGRREEESVPGDVPASGCSPEEDLLADEIMARIDASVRRLPAMDREIAYLRFFEDLRYREISEVTRLNLNTVKSRIRSIREILRKDLEDIFPAGGGRYED